MGELEGFDLQRVFEMLLDLPRGERARRLEQLDLAAETKRRLEAMLAVEDNLGEEEVQRRGYPWPGDHVGAYRLMAPIGDGGMGTVWLAVSRSAPELSVAIKFPRAFGVEGAEAQARLRQERRILASLDHPAIVSLIDAGETSAGVPYLVLKISAGRPLDQYVRELQPTSQQLLAVLRVLGEALDYLHGQGIVHRDLKPANVLVDERGWPLLVDFGAARITALAKIQPSVHTQGAAPHTPAFASPEQERGDEVSASTDVFGWGGLLAASLEAHGDAELGTRAKAVLERAQAERMDQRFDTLGQAAGALEAAWRELDGAAVSPPRRRSRLRRLVRGLMIAAGLFLVFLFGAVVTENQPWERVENRIVEELEGLPAVEIDLEPDDLHALAEGRDSFGFTVAASLRALLDGQPMQPWALIDSLERQHELVPVRRLDLILSLTLSGFPGVALAILEAEPFEDPPLANVAVLLEQLNRGRTDSGLLIDELVDAQNEWLAWQEQEGEGDDFAEYPTWISDEEIPDWLEEEASWEWAFTLARIELGEPDACQMLLEGASVQQWEQAIEMGTPELEVCFELYLGLQATDQVAALPLELCEALEEEWALRWKSRSWTCARPWARVRAYRIRRVLEADPGEAAQLAQEGLERLEQWGTGPADVAWELWALAALALERSGEDEEAQRWFEELMGEAGGIFGEEFAEALEQGWEGVLSGSALRQIGDSEELMEAIERESRERGERPWWAPR